MSMEWPTEGVTHGEYRGYLNLLPCMCVVYVYSCLSVCMRGVHVFTCVCRSEGNAGAFFYPPPPYLGLWIWNSLFRLAGQGATGVLQSLSLHKAYRPHAQLFMWVLGIWTRASIFVQQALYYLSHLTSSCYSALPSSLPPSFSPFLHSWFFEARFCLPCSTESLWTHSPLLQLLT